MSDLAKSKTIFCDIDGTIFKYRKFNTYISTTPESILDVITKLQQWTKDGHCIILTTARPEYLREHTIGELRGANVPYAQLVMGLGRAERYLINDKHPDRSGGDRAVGINLETNQGFANKVDWTQYEL